MSWKFGFRSIVKFSPINLSLFCIWNTEYWILVFGGIHSKMISRHISNHLNRLDRDSGIVGACEEFAQWGKRQVRPPTPATLRRHPGSGIFGSSRRSNCPVCRSPQGHRLLILQPAKYLTRPGWYECHYYIRLYKAYKLNWFDIPQLSWCMNKTRAPAI